MMPEQQPTSIHTIIIPTLVQLEVEGENFPKDLTAYNSYRISTAEYLKLGNGEQEWEIDLVSRLARIIVTVTFYRNTEDPTMILVSLKKKSKQSIRIAGMYEIFYYNVEAPAARDLWRNLFTLGTLK
jgi:hypothetical protein